MEYSVAEGRMRRAEPVRLEVQAAIEKSRLRNRPYTSRKDLGQGDDHPGPSPRRIEAARGLR